jgi:hypothetical protein
MWLLRKRHRPPASTAKAGEAGIASPAFAPGQWFAETGVVTLKNVLVSRSNALTGLLSHRQRQPVSRIAAATVARQRSCSARVRPLRTALGPRMPARPAEHPLNCEDTLLTPFAPNLGNGYVLPQI